MSTEKEKIRVYEDLLHAIHLASWTFNTERLQKLLANISQWSYAHRQGNGTFSEIEQREVIQEAFSNLLS